jgi:hypothetical protein
VSRSKTFTEECGCQWQLQEIPRSLHTREIWTSFCPTHDAEQKAMRDAAHAAHREQNLVRSLTEEL